MKKKLIIIFIVLGLFITGCLDQNTPQKRVETFLNNYIENDKSIQDELDVYIEKEKLTESQKEKYTSIVLDEYKNIHYTIKNEKIDGTKASIEIEINVKDLFKASHEAEEELLNSPSQFYTDGMYDVNKFIDYKLDQMEKEEDFITYTIYINLNLIDEVWVIEELDEITLQKLHGIYNYLE